MVTYTLQEHVELIKRSDLEAWGGETLSMLDSVLNRALKATLALLEVLAALEADVISDSPALPAPYLMAQRMTQQLFNDSCKYDAIDQDADESELRDYRDYLTRMVHNIDDVRRLMILAPKVETVNLEYVVILEVINKTLICALSYGD